MSIVRNILPASVIYAISIPLASQTIDVHSISFVRQPLYENEYTLDGDFMQFSRDKLLFAGNFSENGIYPREVTIIDGYTSSNSLTSVGVLPERTIFFFGAFNMTNASLNQFTLAEIDTLYEWSKRGGKVLIGGSSGIPGFYEPGVLESKWGYGITSQVATISPTSLGEQTMIFNGPFGLVPFASQGAGAQGYFSVLPNDHVVLGVDANGAPTLIMDCTTLDLIIADVDAYTSLGGVSYGTAINNDQDRFWANTIVFMNELQAPPQIVQSSTSLCLNQAFPNYEWYLNGSFLSTGSCIPINAPGTYSVQVELNGGCVANTSIEISNVYDPPDVPLIGVEVPNVFSPNGDGENDVFIPTTVGYRDPRISIYNRWGQEIFTTQNVSAGWNGISAGRECPDGVYFWVINLDQDPYVIKGSVTLLR